MDVVEFINIITSKNFVPSKEEIINLTDMGTLIIHGLDTFDDQAKVVLNKSILGSLKQKDPRMGILVSSLAFAITGKKAHLEKTFQKLLAYSGKMDESLSNFNSLGSLNFNAPPGTKPILESLFNRQTNKRFFNKILRDLNKFIKDEKIPIKDHFTPTNRVLIITQQFLGMVHAPTVDVINYAKILKENFNKEVMICNTMEYAAVNTGAFVPKAGFNTGLELDDGACLGNLDHEGQNYPLLINPSGSFDLQGIKPLIEQIEIFDPSMILVVGARNFLSEVFSKRAFVFMYPTSRGVPLTNNCFFHTWDKPNEVEEKTLKIERLKDLHLFNMHPGFAPPQKKENFNRSKFGIPDDKFVFVIAGLRLGTDVDNDFIEILEKLSEEPKAFFVFLGTFEGYENKINKNPNLREKSILVPPQDDILAFYELCDCYLNPARKGAGSIIIFAQSAGVPTLSLSVGDSGAAVKNHPPISDYQEMLNIALEIIENETLYNEYKELSLSSAKKLTSREPLVEKILEQYEVFASNQK